MVELPAVELLEADKQSRPYLRRLLGSICQPRATRAAHPFHVCLVDGLDLQLIEVGDEVFVQEELIDPPDVHAQLQYVRLERCEKAD